MSIRLEVQPYCENCLIFEADVENPKKLYTIADPSTISIGDTIIRCSNRNLCAGLKRYLERQEENNG